MIEDDKRNRSGVFNTASKGGVPPLVTTQFTTQDQGMFRLNSKIYSLITFINKSCILCPDFNWLLCLLVIMTAYL